jgi:hypothetical protein
VVATIDTTTTMTIRVQAKNESIEVAGILNSPHSFNWAEAHQRFQP